MSIGWKILAAILLVVGLYASGAYTYHHLYQVGYDAGVAFQAQKNKADNLEEEKKATEAFNKVSKELLEEKAKTKTKYITITKEVEKVVDRPVYSNECVDADGVDLINRAYRGE